MGQYTPLITAGTQAAGSILGLYGSYQTSEGQRAEGEAASQAALYNAMLAELEAKRVIEAGTEEEGRLRRGGRRYIAQRRVAVAKSGFTLEGTPLNALLADAKQLELEALYARRGALEEAASLRYGAQLDKQKAKTYRKQSSLAAEGTLIGGFGQAAVGLANAYGTYRALTNPGRY